MNTDNETDGETILWLEEVDMADIDRVGGKNASMGEMIQALGSGDVKVPPGFVVSAGAYRQFLRKNGLVDPLKDVFRDHRKNDRPIERTGLQARELIRGGSFPPEMARSINAAYETLSDRAGESDVDVAVRSSATAEDLPHASFAGQQETFLNIRGPNRLKEAIRECFSSLFTNRAISYREYHDFNHMDVALAVGVQKMVRSDQGASGVAFTLDTESGFRDIVLINATWGLGEMIVQGAVIPDEYLVFKPTLAEGKHAVLEKKMGKKTEKMVYDSGGEETRTVTVPAADQRRYALNDHQIHEIARQAVEIERYYTEKKGEWSPMDVEWALDGQNDQLYVVQARPETVHAQDQSGMHHMYSLTAPEGERDHRELVNGIAIGSQVDSAPVTVMNNLSESDRFQEGDILVTEMTDPDWEPIMKRATAVVTNRGGRTCHAAIVAREMGKPSIVGTGDATEHLTDRSEVTVSCAEGETGHVYEGRIEYSEQEFDLDQLPSTDTDLMVNLGNPEQAFQHAHLPVDGVGLTREEFIINSFIGIHPLALIRFDDIERESGYISAKIKERTRGFDDKRAFFVQKLSQGLAKIAAAFHPNPMIVRFSDFKSNEYANLLGGDLFEPEEANPMIGWRGASRYYSEKFREAFGLECRAIHRVRNEMGLDNLQVMVPFCRTIEEGRKVKETMKSFGLDPNGELDVFVMAELPANITLVDGFAEIFDGFSIGTNDLTQLVLGLDRDSEQVNHLYDERNEAVKRAIARLIQGAHKKNAKVGICGQAPSDFPDFTRFLVNEGIDSISVTPDAVFTTRNVIAEAEDSSAERVPGPERETESV